MKKLSIVVHSGFGHTLYAAGKVCEGVKNKGIDCSLVDLAQDKVDFDLLQQSQTLIFGSPTYMGNVSSVFKKFMEETSGIWQKSLWLNKLAAGFTVSSSPSGDKLATIQTMMVFAMQHAMIWAGYHRHNESLIGVKADEARNFLGSFCGLMLQASSTSPEKSFSPGDLHSAVDFGERIAELTHNITL